MTFSHIFKGKQCESQLTTTQINPVRKPITVFLNLPHSYNISLEELRGNANLMKLRGSAELLGSERARPIRSCHPGSETFIPAGQSALSGRR